MTPAATKAKHHDDDKPDEHDKPEGRKGRGAAVGSPPPGHPAPGRTQCPNCGWHIEPAA